MRTPGTVPLALALVATILAGCSTSEGPGATASGNAEESQDGALARAFPLRIEEVAVEPPTANVGDDLTARAVVKNVGDAQATSKVEFRLGDRLQATSFVTLEAGASTLVAGTVRAARTGLLTLEAKLVESGETKTTALLVHGPDLVDAKVTVLDLQQCDRIAHRVSFRNAGDGAAQDVKVEAHLRDTDGAVVDRIEQDVADLVPNASTLVEFTHVAPARCSGSHTYTLRIVVAAQGDVAMEHTTPPFTV